jgi:hypothetical protein
VEAYGEQRAERVMGRLLRNYTRLAFIDTGRGGADAYRDYSRDMANRFGLRFEELPGSVRLIRKMLSGEADHEIVVARPGETISYMDFKKAS